MFCLVPTIPYEMMAQENHTKKLNEQKCRKLFLGSWSLFVVNQIIIDDSMNSR